MAILKITTFLMMLFLSTFAQFNEFEYEEETKDSLVFEKDPIIKDKTIARVKSNKKNYLVNFIFAGSGLKTNKTRSTIYKSLDIVFFIGVVASYYQSSQAAKTSTSFAAEHAGVYPTNDDMKNALSVRSLKDYEGEDGLNTFYLKQDAYGNMIDEVGGNIWLWDSEENMDTYKNLVSDEKRYDNQMYLFIGGLILNRVVSTLDIAISSRKMRMVPSVDSKSLGLKFEGDI